MNPKRCGAKRRNGQPCQQWPLHGRPRCRLHGGKTPIGPASGPFKTGRYSKYLPVRLAAKYQEAQQDPTLLSVSDDLALLDARLAELLQRVDSGESGARWKALHAAHAAFKLAKVTGPVERMEAALGELESRLDQGVYDYQAWAGIQALWEQRRKLCETESKRLIATQQLMTTQQALLLIGAITDVITRHVRDKPVLSAIIVDLQQIIGRDAVPVYAEGMG